MISGCPNLIHAKKYNVVCIPKYSSKVFGISYPTPGSKSFVMRLCYAMKQTNSSWWHIVFVRSKCDNVASLMVLEV